MRIVVLGGGFGGVATCGTSIASYGGARISRSLS
jgi:NADH dehydrogenase FAD-containing subunit